MGFSSVFRLVDRLREEAERRQRAREVRDQASLFRQWQRLGDAPAQEFMGLASPGSLNPQGMDYERARIGDDTLRPSNYEERQQREMVPGFAPSMEQFAPSMEEIGGLGLQAAAFRGYEPEEYQQALGVQEFGAAPIEEQTQAMYGLSPEQLRAEMYTADPRDGGPFGGLSEFTGMQEQALQEAGQFLIEPQVEAPEWLGEIPVVGTGLEHELELATSPLGMAAYAAMPGPMAVGAQGAILGRATGELAEMAGLPMSEEAKLGMEVGGGMVTGVGGLENMMTRGGRALLPRPSLAEDIIRQVPAEQVARQAPVEEAMPTFRRVGAEQPPVGPGAAEGIPPAGRPAAQAPSARAEVPRPVDAEAAAARAELEVRGIPEMAGGDPAQRLVEAIREARPIRGRVESLRATERARRVAAGAKELEATTGEAAFLRAQRQLGGKMPSATISPPREVLRPGEVNDLFDRIRVREDMPFFTKINTNEALTKILAGELPSRREIVLLEKVFGPELAQEIKKLRPLGPRVFENILSALNLPRAVLASFDLSAPFRQGALLIGHPKEFFGNMGPMVRAFARQNWTDEAAKTWRAGMTPDGRKWDEVMESAKLYISPLEETALLAEREEAFMTSLASKIPGVRQSQRAYVTYLNGLRADVFKNTVAGWEKAGIATAGDEEALARMINIFSGRGELGAVRDWVPAMNTAFFSARLLASRVQAPMQLIFTTPLVRKVVARDLLAFVGYGIGMLSLAKAAGADVELNPRSVDFGKIRVGPTRLDLWAGFQPLARYTAQLITGEAKGSMGEMRDLDRWNTFVRFWRSKLSPAAGAAVDVAAGETFIGEELAASPDQFMDRLMPLFLQDMKEAIEEQGALGAFLALPGAFGASVLSYRTESEKTAAKLAEHIETGAFKGQYDDVPRYIRQLDPADQDRLRELEPELFAELEKAGEETLGGLSEREQRTIRGTRIGQAEENKNQKLDGLVREMADIEASEQESRRDGAERIKDFRSEYGTIVQNAYEEFGPLEGDEETFSPEQRLRQRYREFNDQHQARFTAVETDELWAAYEADYQAEFTDEERAQLEEIGVEGVHDVEKGWRKLNNALRSYYDISIEERNGSRDRKRLRRDEPEIDAALWALGRVSKVQSPNNKAAAIAAFEQLYGVRPDEDDVEWSGRGGRSYERSYQR